MQYMIIEHFKNRDAAAVYRRFRDQGRLAPEGLTYVSSWIELNFNRCFQVMECSDPKLLQQWIARWADLTDFEVIPVVSSAETLESLKPLL